MCKKVLFVAVFAFSGFFSAPCAAEEPPASAQVEGIVNDNTWPVAICFLASLGQLIAQRDPGVTSTDVIVRSGLATQASWALVGKTGYTLDVHPRAYDNGEMVDASRLCGVGMHVCFARGGGGGYGTVRAADAVTLFRSQQEAVTALKTRIAEGIPVQVHVDFQYLYDEAAPQYPRWYRISKSPCSHFVVVHGYDADNIYFTDNGPHEETGETGENIAISWGAFLAGWAATPALSPDRHLLTGPYYMLYLTGEPVLSGDDWTTAWLAADSSSVPEKIRMAAQAIRAGRGEARVMLSEWSIGRFRNSRPYIAAWLDNLGHSDIADLYQTSADLWSSIPYEPDWDTVPDVLEDIADAEEEALALMAEVAPDADPICLLSPTEGAGLGALEDVTFRWAALPSVRKVIMQISMTGDFDDSRTRGVFASRPFKTFVKMKRNNWLKILRKDDGDLTFSWRVKGVGKQSSLESASRENSWDLLEMQALSPIDGYAASAGELVEFTWSAPHLSIRPRVAISTSGDFDDRAHRLYLVPKAGQSRISMRPTTMAALRARDSVPRGDGDGIVYWHVEDANSKVSTVQPCEVRALLLPSL